MQTVNHQVDPNAQLRALYRSLLEDQDRYHEFKQLLALYPSGTPGDEERADAAEIREQLNGKIRAWVGNQFDGLSAMQVTLWRTIIVEERFNVAVAPWKESNGY